MSRTVVKVFDHETVAALRLLAPFEAPIITDNSRSPADGMIVGVAWLPPEDCVNAPFDVSYGLGSLPDHSSSTHDEFVADPIV
jgi:hypothetical protein